MTKPPKSKKENARVSDADVKRAREMPVAEIWERLGFQPVKPGTHTTCPWREEKTASLQVGGAKNIVYDYGPEEAFDSIDLVRKAHKCGFKAAVEWILGSALTERHTPPAKTATPPKQAKREPRRLVAQYDYTDEQGKVLFQVQRYEPKTFSQRAPNGKGGWKYKLNDVRRVLYRLPRVVWAIENQQPIFVCEGEKDVETLEKLDKRIATTMAKGSKWSKDFTGLLKGAHVVLLPDNDAAGTKSPATLPTP